MHFGSDGAACVLGGGGGGGIKGHAFNVIGLRYEEFIIIKLLFIGVYNKIFNYQIPEKKINYDGFLEIMLSLLILILLNKTPMIQLQYMITPIASTNTFIRHIIIKWNT